MINRLAKHYDVEPGVVVRYELIDGGAVVRSLIDYGIQGIKVYELRVDDLKQDETITATYDLDYRELQALAKKHGIPANQSKGDLYAALLMFDEEE